MMSEALLIFIGGLFITIALGIPTVYGLGFVSLLYLFIERGFEFPPDLFVVPIVNSVNSFLLLAVPLFFFVGRLMNECGLTDRLFAFANSLVGHIRGGLGQVNVLNSMIFAGMSGSATADAAGPGAVEYKAMIDQGYSPEFSAGISLASCMIGPIIPPSIPVLIYAAITEISATALLMAGLLPGILIGLLQMAMVALYCRKRPKGRRATLKELGVAFKRSFLTLLTPFILVVGIGGGIFTATEAAAIGALYLLIISVVVYRTVSLKQIVSISRGVIGDTAVVMFLLSTATFYGWMLTRLRIPAVLLEQLLSFSTNGYVIMFIVVAFLLVMGCFFSTAVGLVIVAPIVAPIPGAFGFDPIHFGIVAIISMVVGTVTPPVGSALFAMMRVTGLTMEKVVQGTLPFLLITIVAIVVVILIPQIAMFFPNLLLGR